MHFLEILVFWQFVFRILVGSGDVLGAFSGAVGVENHMDNRKPHRQHLKINTPLHVSGVSTALPQEVDVNMENGTCTQNVSVPLFILSLLNYAFNLLMKGC
jgi:hypothetical protein